MSERALTLAESFAALQRADTHAETLSRLLSGHVQAGWLAKARGLAGMIRRETESAARGFGALGLGSLGPTDGSAYVETSVDVSDAGESAVAGTETLGIKRGEIVPKAGDAEDDGA